MPPETLKPEGQIDLKNATVEDFEKDIASLKNKRMMMLNEVQKIEDSIIRIEGMRDLKAAQEKNVEENTTDLEKVVKEIDKEK